MLGEEPNTAVELSSLTKSNKIVLFVVCAAVIAFGVYPKPLNDLAEAGTKSIMILLNK